MTDRTCRYEIGPDQHGPARRCGDPATHMQDPERPTWTPGSTRFYCERHADRIPVDCVEIRDEWPCPCCGKTLDHQWGCEECQRIIQFGSPHAKMCPENYVGIKQAADRCDKAHEEGIDSLGSVYA